MSSWKTSHFLYWAISCNMLIPEAQFAINRGFLRAIAKPELDKYEFAATPSRHINQVNEPDTHSQSLSNYRFHPLGLWKCDEDGKNVPAMVLK